ncbi:MULTISPECIES: hypothetical protein [Mycobacterium avium complex (MAC)]|uniref:hypothetical protein n=1 Tax=Mycobacterium avium complex (MAC) TaxID=120793 RepID=UPI0004505C76|nr:MULTISPECIES: hypothetical protein [Mycobacterium avium complex (MAC)]ETZ58390.1 hypothetical protein L840_2631 [Mycobacterium sp. MAC_011194_8550]ETZ59370.1 hypothetical protein L841_4777 [Mycobacterium sp. MAC_080597_8934]MBZ4572107.1 hypothetical protein [Mycobacterium avium subsp. hominissuis]MCA4729124.1 hypothetical protein [Mycobacterium avium subsp. hominissuis]MDO2358825.1 hypothetical protein [Mycobacterium avium subsp. hominissuis]
MSIDNESTASRQFVASAAAFSSKWTKGIRYWQVGYTAVFIAFVVFIAVKMLGTLKIVNLRTPHIGAAAIYALPIGLVVVGAAIGGYLWWRSRRTYLLTVAGDRLTIGRRRPEVYPLADAQLGLWVDNGVALHLHSGRRRFVLGGRDRRIGPGTPLAAPPVPLVDASLGAADFDELLALGGWSAARGPATGEPIRCLLFPNPLETQRMGSFALRKKQRLIRSLSQPQLLIDLDADSIRVIDPNNDAVMAMTWVARVTATPATYRLPAGHAVPSAQHIASDAVGQYFSTMPALRIDIAGMAPLTVGCRAFDGLKQRCSWSPDVPTTHEPPTYAVSAADWQSLVEKLGLAARLADTA